MLLTPAQKAEAIRAIALFEAKGAIVLLAGLGVLSLIHRDVQHVADQVVHHMHLTPRATIPRIFLHAAAHVTNRGLWWLAAGALAYCLVRFVEAYGLWRQRAWAEVLAAASGADHLPFELYRLTRGESVLAATALVLNLVVVAFMLYALWTRRRARSVPPA